MATRIDASPGVAHSEAWSNPLESIAERRWFTLGVLIATVLAWTQVSNPIAWIGFLVLLAGILAWIQYGNARSGHSAAGALGRTFAWLAGVVAFGSIIAAAISYAERTAAPSWVYTVIGGVILAGILLAAWRITAPLRAAEAG